MKEIITNPMIPIWLMSILCVLMLIVGFRKNVGSIIRRILIVILLFIINLRIMIPGEPVEIKKQELNSYCLFVVDNTISMIALDGHDGQTRLDAFGADSEYIIDSLPGAHFSVLGFNNSAMRLSPFTDNGEHTVNVISSIYPPQYFYCKGSSMNVAYDAMVDMLKDIRKKDGIKVYVFFVSDGEDNTGVERASFSEIAKYIDGGAVLGYGTETGAQMHYISPYDANEIETITYWDDNYNRVPAISRINEKNLKALASDMNVPYIHMEKETDINGVVNDIKKEAGVVLTEHSITTMDTATDTYYYYVFPLIALLMWEAVALLRKK